MAFQFPASPVVGQVYTPSAGLTFKWNGTAWYLVNSTLLTPTEADTRYVQIANARSMESRIINGSFAIDQRNAGAVVSVTNSDVYVMDRWVNSAYGAGVFSVRRQIYFGGEYTHSVNVMTPDAAPAGGSLYATQQVVEGTHAVDLYFGTIAARPITIAFWVTSGIVGTFPVLFKNGAATRTYIATFTVNTANNQELKVITVPGDTAGTWLTNNGVGLRVGFCYGAGSPFQAPAPNVWSAGNFFTVAGCTNFMASPVNTGFSIQHVRLYPGTIDYGPCQRLYADELRLCQRYYCKSYDQSNVPGAITFNGVHMGVTALAGGGSNPVMVRFPVTMRQFPTIVAHNPETGATGTWSGGATPVASYYPTDAGCVISNSGVVSVGQLLYGHWTASAEL